MEDNIERIREDIDEEAMEHRGCYDHDGCESCPSKRVDEERSKARRIELVKRARALFERQLPEGVEWPRFEDGELVKIGDAYEKASGTTGVVTSIHLRRYGGVPTWVIGKGGGKVCVRPGERVKRAEPADTQEKIDADAEKSFCEYFGRGSGIRKEGGACEAHGSDEPCRAIMIRDLLRRQRELCERGAR